MDWTRRCACRALRFLNTTLLLGPLMRASASFLLSIDIVWDRIGLPGLLTGDYVPVDALDKVLDEPEAELFTFLIGCYAGFAACDTCSVLNLLSVRVLSLRKAFMCCDYFNLYTFNAEI